MIAEEYVAFETAKLLKDAGFPQEPASAFREYFDGDGNHILKQPIARPTQAQAMRWLREEHKLMVGVTKEFDGFYFDIFDLIDLVYISGFSDLDCEHPTYELAIEAGIQATCMYLIEMENKD